MQFVAVGSEFSGLPGYWLTFPIFGQGLKKTHMNWQPGIRKGHFEDFFEVPGKKSKKVSQ